MNSLNLNRCRVHPSHTRSSSTTEREGGSSELVSNILNKSFRLVCECFFTIPRKRLENYSVLVYDGMCSSQQLRECTVRRKSFWVGGNKISDDRGTSSIYQPVTHERTRQSRLKDEKIACEKIPHISLQHKICV